MPLFKQDKPTLKQIAKLKAWRNWSNGMAMLRAIHKDINEKKAQFIEAQRFIEHIGN